MKTFAQAFCERFGCAPEDYVAVALTHCLYPHARLLSRLFGFHGPPEDIELLKQAGEATTEIELEGILRDYWYRLRFEGSYLARRLKLRVSGRYLQKLFRDVMGETKPAV